MPTSVARMQIGRREFITAAIVGTAVTLVGAPQAAASGLPEHLTTHAKAPGMYGLIGKMLVAPGQRDAFIAILLTGVGDMPGCLSYVVAKDTADENALWITEVWDSKASHDASLSLPAVKEAIAKGRPMITGFGEQVVTAPVGGQGLQASAPR